MNGAGWMTGCFGKPFGGPSSGGGQGKALLLSVKGSDQGPEAGCLAGTRPTGQDRDGLGQRH